MGKTKVIKNKEMGIEIHLAETNDIEKLKCQLMLLGTNGLAYSPWAKEIWAKIEKLEKSQNTPRMNNGK